MLIRNIRIDDYEIVDKLMQQLHKIHVDGRKVEKLWLGASKLGQPVYSKFRIYSE